MQVSPTEIEDVLLVHPEKLIVDVCVVGVPGSRTSDEKIPRAWIVLSEAGKVQGEKTVIEKLNAWANTNLSPYKKLRGGIEVIDEVSEKLSLSSYTGDTVVLIRYTSRRFQRILQARRCVANLENALRSV